MDAKIAIGVFVLLVMLVLIVRCDQHHAAQIEPTAAGPKVPPKDRQSSAKSGGQPRKESHDMAWTVSRHLIEGELDNTQPGKVSGWLQLAGIQQKVSLDLTGDFDPDIRGSKLHLRGFCPVDDQSADIYMVAFAAHQTGTVSGMNTDCVEWQSTENGRVVLDLRGHEVQLISSPTSSPEAEPSPEAQPTVPANAIPQQQVTTVGTRRDQPRTSHPGHQLMPEEVRKQLPRLYAQESKGGKAIAYVKYFTPDSSWTWLATEFDGDDTLFGLVDGHYRELGYFSLTELLAVRGPLGLPIERDLHWKPTPLEQIAPVLFERQNAAK